MPDPYATEAELNTYLPAGIVVVDADRLLARASALLDEKVRSPFSVDDDGIPTDPDVAAAMRDACCAQVEFWLEVGEDHDVSGLANRQVSIGHLSMAALPPRLAPRALTSMVNAGLMGSSQTGTTAGVFFTAPEAVA